MSKIVIVYHSGYGHTAVQAQAVARGATKVAGTEVVLVKVEEVDDHWGTLEGADAIIFGSPTYMGNVSAAFQAFAEKSSKVWMDQGWKDKIAAGFTNSGSQSGDKLASLIHMAIFAAQHSMIWVGLGLLPGNNHSKGSVEDLNRLGGFLGAMAQSNVDQGPDVVPPVADQRTAEMLGERVATMASRFKAA